MTKAPTSAPGNIYIPPPNLGHAEFSLRGTSPYVQHKFSEKARRQMLDAQIEGSRAKGKKKRESRDIEAEYKAAMHLTEDGRTGIPANAFRNCMISACRLVGVVMTRAKLSIFAEADAFDADDDTPLVYFTKGEPQLHESAVRLATGVASIAIRPIWREWECDLRVTFDNDQFDVNSVANLLARAGLQVGVGEGRHDSKRSTGMGWGQFVIVNSTALSD